MLNLTCSFHSLCCCNLPIFKCTFQWNSYTTSMFTSVLLLLPFWCDRETLPIPFALTAAWAERHRCSTHHKRRRIPGNLGSLWTPAAGTQMSPFPVRFVNPAVTLLHPRFAPRAGCRRIQGAKSWASPGNIPHPIPLPRLQGTPARTRCYAMKRRLPQQ